MTYDALFRAYDYLTARGIPMPEDVKTELIRLGLPATKALQEYDNSLHRIVAMYIQDLRTKPINEVMNFGIEFAGAIDAGLNEAWRLGMRENDVTEMDDEMQAIVDEYIASEREHIPDFAEFITQTALSAENIGEAINGVANRLAMWVTRYEDVRNQAILYTADEKTKLVWIYGDTQHCTTCAALNGIVAYAREWDMFPFRPQNPKNDYLECGGWRCQCQLTPTDSRHTVGAVDKLQEIYDSLGEAKAAKYDPDQPRDEAGRWTDGGGSDGGDGGTGGDGGGGSERIRKYGDNIQVTSDSNVTIGGDLSSAYYDKASDTIYISKEFLDSATDEQIAGVIAHEEYHRNESRIDKQVIRDAMIQGNEEYLSIAGQDMDYDERIRYEDDYRILYNEIGGVSEYSNQYFRNSSLGFDRAISETMAEISRLIAEGRANSIPPIWMDIYKKINR